MADLYDEDIVLWSERQVNALRRRAANEIDWDNVAEEIEDVGRSEINATLSQIDNILRHRLYLLGWPNSPSVRKWQVELREFHRQLRRHHTPSMTGGQEPKISDATVTEAYGAAVDYCLVHMDTEPTHPLPETCPWSLTDILRVVP
jgi:Domain of unknown function DUF29